MKSRATLATLTTIGLLAASGAGSASEKLLLRVTPNVSSRAKHGDRQGDGHQERG